MPARGYPVGHDARMTKVIYTAEAHIDGGREDGHGRTSDGALEVDLRPPGTAGGTNPEQLFAIGYAACFEGALGVVAKRRGVDIGRVGIDSEVRLLTPDGKNYDVGATLNVTLPNVDDAATAVEIVEEAHQVCPYSRATRGNI